MSYTLKQIQNWPERVRLTNYSVSRLAKNCGTSVRTLQRHFQQEMGTSPKKWLVEQRQLHAAEILNECSCVKETAVKLGYKHQNHFSRDFKTHWGYCPAETISRQTLNP